MRNVLALAITILVFGISPVFSVGLAEVSASSGPIKLTLQIFNPKVALREVSEEELDMKCFHRELEATPKRPDGEIDSTKIPDTAAFMRQCERKVRRLVADPVWFKVSITNIGRKPIGVDGRIFDPELDLDEVLALNNSRHFSIYFRVIGPDGNTVPLRERPVLFDGCMRNPDAPMGEDQLVSPNELKQPPKHSVDELQRLVLEPGRSATSPRWIYSGDCSPRNPVPVPPDDAAELWSYEFSKPGSYSIRAVYDQAPTPTMLQIDRKRHIPLAPEDVRIVTPPLLLEVAR